MTYLKYYTLINVSFFILFFTKKTLIYKIKTFIYFISILRESKTELCCVIKVFSTLWMKQKKSVMNGIPPAHYAPYILSSVSYYQEISSKIIINCGYL